MKVLFKNDASDVCIVQTGDEKMYRGLWNFVTKYMDDSHAVSVFLPVMIIGWTLAGVLAGLVVCMYTGTGVVTALADLICAGGYAGLILGLFGGCFFLYRIRD